MAVKTITVRERNLWVFNLPLPKDDAFNAISEPLNKWDEDGNYIDWPMAEALGVPYLDHDMVEPLWIDDLTCSLSDHILALTRADPEAMTPHKGMLDAATGLAIFINRDFNDAEPSRTPDDPYQFLGVYKQEAYTFSLGAPPAAAKPPVVSPQPSWAAPQPVGSKNPQRNALVAVVLCATVFLVFAIFNAIQ